jgi:thiaminase/transcriptional activator TenA
MPWTRSAWREITPLHSQILLHPFITGLADGSLPEEAFIFYLAQDSIFLDEFAKVLAGLALSAPTADDTRTLAGFASKAENAELALHESYLRGRDKPHISPACELYTSWLYKMMVKGPWAVGLAAVLPCFWIYLEVGDHVLRLSPAGSDNPYQPWIDTYGGQEYAVAVRSAMGMADRAAESVAEPVRLKMTEAFVAAAKLEWLFWDSAWRRESWPI